MKKKRRKPSALMSALDQAHGEEITVQNEQLLKAQRELEQARDRYADLYDFAPIGYLSLDPNGRIVDINLAGAALLGRTREYLITMPLSSLIAGDDRERFREFLWRSLDTINQAAPEVEVTLRGAERTVRLVARPITPNLGPSQLFAAMLDVTEHRRLEAERQRIHEAERHKTAELAREVAVRLTAEERVNTLLARLIEIQEQERRRLALNLHDQLGQQLTALRLTMDALKTIDPASAEGRARFEIMEKIVAQLDRDVDLLVWELRPAPLQDTGLQVALEEFVRQWSWTQGIEAEFHSSLESGARLAAEVESQLYRIVQEALNNISKHAHAKHVSVLLERRGDDLTLIVEDDGRGFDVEAVRRAAKSAGMGLVGMHERAASLGGRMQYESARDKGTTLFVRIPIHVATPSTRMKNRRF